MTSLRMRAPVLGLILFSFFPGCGKKGDSGSVMGPILSAWQAGDREKTTSLFVAADWGKTPLFDPASPFSISEEDFLKLSASDRDAKVKVLLGEVKVVREMTQAVIQEGKSAAAKKDTTQARKVFTAVKDFSIALDKSKPTELVKAIGSAIGKMADVELGKLGKS